MNINTLIVLEYWCFLKIGNLCIFSIIKNIIPNNIKNNHDILVEGWYSLEQYIGFEVRLAFNYYCSLHPDEDYSSS